MRRHPNLPSEFYKNGAFRQNLRAATWKRPGASRVAPSISRVSRGNREEREVAEHVADGRAVTAPCRGAKVGKERPMEVREREVFDGSCDGDARIVDEDVNGTVSRDDRLRDDVDRLRVGDVADVGRAPRRHRRHGVQSGAIDVRQSEGRAAASELRGQRSTDPTGGSRNDRDGLRSDSHGGTILQKAG